VAKAHAARQKAILDPEKSLSSSLRLIARKWRWGNENPAGLAGFPRVVHQGAKIFVCPGTLRAGSCVKFGHHNSRPAKGVLPPHIFLGQTCFVLRLNEVGGTCRRLRISAVVHVAILRFEKRLNINQSFRRTWKITKEVNIEI
jgi:hypothetical protein